MGNGIIVLIDIDDTIEDLLPAWLEALNSKFGTNVRYDDISCWDVSEYFPTLERNQVFEPLHNEKFWKTVKPKQDAMQYVKILFDEGYDIYLCTSTDYRNIRAKYEYIIKEYFPYIEWNHVIVIQKKQLIKADILIDDGIHNLVGGDFLKILMTAPHNKKYDAESNGIARADNWQTVYEIVHRYNKEGDEANGRKCKTSN